MKRLFISKEVSDSFVAFCHEHGITLNAVPLIETHCIPNAVDTSYDVAFFASKNAARCFLANNSLKANVEIACAGEATKSYLEELGYHISFVPRNSGNVAESAEAFATYAGIRQVLLPHSNKSLLSYAAFLTKEQLVTCEVYQTNMTPKAIPQQDIYVFTSPSNVESFLQCNVLKDTASIIAWGTSTQAALRANNIEAIALNQASEDALLHMLLEF